jgi:serine phosphatase RsbU (regulator of sigma subunit)
MAHMGERRPGDRVSLSPGQSTVVVSLVAIGLLFFTLLVSYTFFHLLAEVFFSIVAVSVFLMAWMLREFLDDDLPVFLGIVLLTASILHVVHTADYPGVGIITASPDPPTQLWVALTLLEAASFLAAPFVMGRRIRILPVLAAYLLVDGLVLASVYWWKIFPVTLTTQGLTPFKIAGEYAACAMFAGSAVLFWRRRSRLQPGAAPFLISAIVSSIVAELWFTAYRTPHTWPNALGHAFLVLSALLLYRAVVEESLARPHALAVSGLRESEEAARAGQHEEEAARKALDRLLAMTPTFYQEKSYAESAAAVCTAAREMFGADAVTLHAIEGDYLVVIATSPALPSVPPSTRFALADDPDLVTLITRRIPSFLSDTSRRALGPGLARLSKALGEHSVLRAPIGLGRVADKLLVLGWSKAHEVPDAAMLALVQRFADQAALALTQARRREAQAETELLHRRLEASLLPNLELRNKDLTVIEHSLPGERRLELGGDFLDVLDLDSGVAVIVGDVAGHGPDAAALGATLRSAWAALIMGGVQPADVARTLRQVIERERTSPDTYATCCLAWVNPESDQVGILNFGHPAPLLLGTPVTPLTVPPLTPLGTFDEPVGEPVVWTLPPGWNLFFYTDGLIESRASRGSSERFGQERLIHALGALEYETVDDQYLARLLRGIQALAGEPFPDDVTVVLVGKRPFGPQPDAVSQTLSADATAG